MAVLTDNEKSISERVVSRYELLGYNKMKAGKTEFAQVLGVSNANLSKYMSLDRPFPIDSIVKLANKHNQLSTDLILFGNDPITRGSVFVPYVEWRDFPDYIQRLINGDTSEPKNLINFPFRPYNWDESHHKEKYLDEFGFPSNSYTAKKFRAFQNYTNNIT
ncbi:hypothetical protein [Rufibacter latericius]|uniref:Uncharacterized protein n=1 Tax=Rufibacter latericius TaxID=2487040 RepID=A0A3M9MU91_9BACT|nr:hypothetical protein [Rufibacter latericius]RNI29091.1 hypothetical protein EFB08_06575 [Rufibacter latericius]